MMWQSCLGLRDSDCRKCLYGAYINLCKVYEWGIELETRKKNHTSDFKTKRNTQTLKPSHS